MLQIVVPWEAIIAQGYRSSQPIAILPSLPELRLWCYRCAWQRGVAQDSHSAFASATDNRKPGTVGFEGTVHCQRQPSKHVTKDQQQLASPSFIIFSSSINVSWWQENFEEKGLKTVWSSAPSRVTDYSIAFNFHFSSSEHISNRPKSVTIHTL